MKSKILLLLGLSLALAVVWKTGLLDLLSLEAFNAQRERLEGLLAREPLLTSATFFAFYVAVTAFSLPGAAVMTLAAGALFGFWQGLLLVSFASSIGATLAFLIARLLLRDWVQSRYGDYLQRINDGVEKDGVFYLFSLRLVPAVPFFVINLVMALTPMKVVPFYWVSQLGMLAGTAIYVNAGTQLGQIGGGGPVLSVSLLVSFVMLAIFPWIARALFNRFKRKRALGDFRKPEYFDNNLVVIGAGSAGLVSSLIASTVKARVTLIERHKMGGDCLNTGCVPSKAMIRSARIARYIQRAPEFGLEVGEAKVDFAAVMKRIHATIAAIEPHDSVERYTEMGVNCVQGEARIVTPWEVEVDGHRISARNIVLASGGRPGIPPIPGLDAVDYLTSDSLWDITECPGRLLVLGGGPIGAELAQAFHRLGAKVTVVVRSRFLPKEDADVADPVAAQFRSEGIELLEHCESRQFGRDEKGEYLEVCVDDAERRIEFDRVLVATGRVANVEDLGLEDVGVFVNSDGTVAVDEYLCTDCPTIYAAGDVAGPYQFTHVSSHQAWYAAVNSLFGTFRRFKADYRVIPWVTFTDPEVARVGLSETEAKKQSVRYEVTRYGIDDLDRAIADGEAHGFVKVLTRPGSDRILGVTIVGYHASELIAEYILAMKHNLGLNKILSTIHIYPTLSEANKFAAGEWKKARKPEALLKWVQRFHTWRR